MGEGTMENWGLTVVERGGGGGGGGRRRREEEGVNISIFNDS